MITLQDAARLTHVRDTGLKKLIASGALPAEGSGPEDELTTLSLSALARVQDLKARCIREAAKAFAVPAGEMFRTVKKESCIFDVLDGRRIVIDEESEAYLVQELLKGKGGGSL